MQEHVKWMSQVPINYIIMQQHDHLLGLDNMTIISILRDVHIKMHLSMGGLWVSVEAEAIRWKWSALSPRSVCHFLLCLSTGQIHLHMHRWDQAGTQTGQHCCQSQCSVQAHLRKSTSLSFACLVDFCCTDVKTSACMQVFCFWISSLLDYIFCCVCLQLQMLGYDVSWAAFNIVEVMSSSKFTYKVRSQKNNCPSVLKSS